MENNRTLLDIFQIVIIFGGLYIISLTIYKGFTNLNDYITPTFIPIGSFIISVLYFLLNLQQLLSRSRLRNSTKKNQEGFINFLIVFILVSGFIALFSFKTIPTPASDILTVISIVIVLSSEILSKLYIYKLQNIKKH